MSQMMPTQEPDRREVYSGQEKQPKQGKRVMLVEPNRIVQMLLSCFLQQEQHLLAIHASYRTALEALESPILLCVPPQVVLVSVQIQQRECVHLLAYLLHETAYRETRIILMMHEEEYSGREVQRLLQYLHAQVLFKPVRVQDVLHLINHASS